jgi:hypothetical protein
MTVTVTWSGGSTTCTNNIDVVRKPFFKITNGDLLVGGEYPSVTPDICPGTLASSNANVYSWATVNSATDRKGANTEHVAKILGTALEVYSAGSGYSSIPASITKKWLTISNTSGEWGSSSGGIACMTDIFSATKKDSSTIFTIPSSLYAPSSLPITGDQAQYTGDLTLNGATGLTGKRAIYVEGNVYIANDIKMNTAYPNGVSDIPFFALIVKGNIYIGKDVTQLDGMYVAQPNGASGGTIFTCAKGAFTSYSTTDLTTIPGTYFSNCSNPLTFNGIVQAKKLRLHRVSGTLSTNIPAEIFNNLPELNLAGTPFRKTTSDSAQYDSAATLPPLL